MTEEAVLSLSAADAKLRAQIQAGEKPRVLIIGGGITGAAIFAKMSAAGLQPWLLERGDFASGTSSRSSKMLHGGLRYIASGDLKTVRQSAQQKNWFAGVLPNHVAPLPFLFLHRDGEFPSAGIFDLVLRLYDRISGGKKHRRITAAELPLFMPGFNVQEFKAANLYYDAITDDVALVYSLLLTGIKHGGLCANYVAVEEIMRTDDAVSGVTISHRQEQKGGHIPCSMVVNATGVWANTLHPLPRGGMRPLRGSHIVLPGWKFPVAASITVSHPQDKRPVYLYPWQGMTVVGCTDLLEVADLTQATYMREEERDYLLAAINSLKPRSVVTCADIVSSWAGLRPIVSQTEGDSDPSKESRHHQIWQQPGLVSIAGGKLATAMPMADDILQAVGAQWRQDFSSTQLDSLQSWRAVSSINELENVAVDGAIKCLEDLFIRRTRLGLTLGRKLKRYRGRIEVLCLTKLGWSEQKFDTQWREYWTCWEAQYSPEPWGGDNE